MRCFWVLVHGQLQWSVPMAGSDSDVSQPEGFYCHRFVLASDPSIAAQKAFASVSANLDRQTGWLRNGVAKLDLEAEEVVQSALIQAFRPDNRGHTFY